MAHWYDTPRVMRICQAIVDVSEIGSRFDPDGPCYVGREAAAAIGTAKVTWATGFDGIRDVDYRTWAFTGICEGLRCLLVQLRTEWMEQQMQENGFRKAMLLAPSHNVAEGEFAVALLANTPSIEGAMDAFVDRRAAVRAAA